MAVQNVFQPLVMHSENPIDAFAEQLNSWGTTGVPFVFVVDYLMQKPFACRLDEVDPAQLQFCFNGFGNDINADSAVLKEFYFKKNPIHESEYRQRFQHVIDNLKAGNSFLVNLSVPTDIETNLSLRDIFEKSEAPYRLLFKDEFVCFSPEIFVKISGNRISSFPMKGTIDASLPNAAGVILNDHKEAAEHATIVDLIRNDLSMVCQKVWVERYRYIDSIQANDKCLLQVSSEISGILAAGMEMHFGDILKKMLPAGSITGAPKPSTMQIIADAEGYERGYYTGVMGYFDGENFESAVMIRFIENQNGRFVFKSGGGITALSQVESEYKELIDKVYLPFTHAPQTVF